jgi:hypothetical protein
MSTPSTTKRQEAEFMYAYFFREILRNLESTEEDLVRYFRCKLAHDKAELNHINEFEDYYEPRNAIFWHTRDTFLYRLLNKAYREQDTDTTYSIRHFIKDLDAQLTELHRSQQTSSTLIHSSTLENVYRGQLMKNEEFDRKIRNNVNGFFSVNGFLSTTQNRELARFYAGDGSQTDQMQSVLFQVGIDKGVNKYPYANISAFSASKNRKVKLYLVWALYFEYNPSVKMNPDFGLSN